MLVFMEGGRFLKIGKSYGPSLRKDGVAVLDVTVETAEIFGEIKAELRKKGTLIPLNDIWIAAHALETGSKLVTYDKHFKSISGLRMWEVLQ